MAIVRRRDGRLLRSPGVRRVHRGPRPDPHPRRGLEEGRARLRDPGGARHPRAGLRGARRCGRPATRRVLLDRDRTRAGGDLQPGARPLGVPVPDDDDHGPRHRDRLRAVHRLALSGGAGGREAGARGDRGRRGDREPGGALQRARVRARDVRPPSRPGLRAAQPRGGRADRRARVGRGGAHARTGHPRSARRPRELTSHPVRRASRGVRREGGSNVVGHRAGGDEAPRGEPRRLGGPPAGRGGARPRPPAVGPRPALLPRRRSLEGGLRRARGGVRCRNRRLRARGRRRRRHASPAARGDRATHAHARRERVLPRPGGGGEPGPAPGGRRDPRRRRQQGCAGAPRGAGPPERDDSRALRRASTQRST